MALFDFAIAAETRGRAEEAGPGGGMRPGHAERTRDKRTHRSNPTRRAAVSDVATESIAAGLLPPSPTAPPDVAQSARMQPSPIPARQIRRRQRNQQLAVYRRSVAMRSGVCAGSTSVPRFHRSCSSRVPRLLVVQPRKSKTVRSSQPLRHVEKREQDFRRVRDRGVRAWELNLKNY